MTSDTPPPPDSHLNRRLYPVTTDTSLTRLPTLDPEISFPFLFPTQTQRKDSSTPALVPVERTIPTLSHFLQFLFEVPKVDLHDVSTTTVNNFTVAVLLSKVLFPCSILVNLRMTQKLRNLCNFTSQNYSSSRGRGTSPRPTPLTKRREILYPSSVP